MIKFFLYVHERTEFPELSHAIVKRDFGDCIAYHFLLRRRRKI